mgnify:FL=1
MDYLLNFAGNRFKAIILLMGLLGFGVLEARAVTSPYVTTQTDVPLNQATNDSINGLLPYFSSHTPQESGSVSRLVDAASATSPNANVILGPDNAWVEVAWNFGAPPAGHVWRLDRLDAWIIAGDNLRKGYRAEIFVSTDGNNFTVVSNSLHWAGLTQNSRFNHVRYDFPNNYIAGATNTMDRFPVKGFQYLRFNSRGDSISGTDWQTRFVEMDIWVSPVPVKFSSVQRDSNGDVTLGWDAILGRTYHLEYKNDLGETDWTHLTAVTTSTETGSYIDTTSGGASRLYRLVLQP